MSDNKSRKKSNKNISDVSSLRDLSASGGSLNLNQKEAEKSYTPKHQQ
jgi:hypothetical protein